MRSLIGVACLIVLILESAVVVRPSAGPSTKKGTSLPAYQKKLKAQKPEVVFVGNSILRHSTDEKVFTQLTGTKTLIVGHDGSASAWWYLALKNVILDPRTRQVSSPRQRPRLVVFFFRDYALTDPAFRVTGEYKADIDGMSTPEEPVLDTLAYQGTMNPLTYLLYRYCPLYRHRQAVRQQLNSRIRNEVVPFLTGIPGGADQAIDRTFMDENMDAEQLTMRQLAAASRQMEDACDFEKQLDQSFLPHLIGLAKDHGVRLAFVRMKRRRDTAPNREPPALQKYIRDLETHLVANQVPLIDFTHEPSITLDLYGAGDHLRATRAIRCQFTSLLAERLTPALATLPE